MDKVDRQRIFCGGIAFTICAFQLFANYLKLGVFLPHPEDRIYTVLSGTFYIGLGELFGESKLMPFEPGSVVVLPGGQSHFHWAKSDEYITQVSAIGPLGLSYVDSANDPRNRNQVEKEMAS